MCSDNLPCEDCLCESNVVEIKVDVKVNILGGMAYLAQRGRKVEHEAKYTKQAEAADKTS